MPFLVRGLVVPTLSTRYNLSENPVFSGDPWVCFSEHVLKVIFTTFLLPFQDRNILIHVA